MSGAELTAGEAEVCGTQVKVVVEGFLRSVFSRDGIDMAQVVFPSGTARRNRRRPPGGDRAPDPGAGACRQARRPQA